MNASKQPSESPLAPSVSQHHPGKPEGFIPTEALEESEALRKNQSSVGMPPTAPQKGRRSDPFSEERVAKNQPAMDSSEETLGG